MNIAIDKLKKKYEQKPLGELTKPDPSIAVCPRCGSKAEYKTSYSSDGYCSYKEGYVCRINPKCMLQTPKMCVDGYCGSKTTKEDIINL